MPKTATKASNNEFYKARMSAVSFNDRLGSREGASEEIGIDRTRLAKIELGTINPYPEEVLMIADVYNTPELMNHYCSKMCPLGKRTVPPAEMRSIDRLTIQVVTVLNEANTISSSLLDIAKDGKVTPNESEQMLEIAAALEQIAITAQEVKMWVTKHLKCDANKYTDCANSRLER